MNIYFIYVIYILLWILLHFYYYIFQKFKNFYNLEIQKKSNFWSYSSGVGMMTAGSRNFRKLFSYISGNNEPKQKIPMTVPVLQPLRKSPNGGKFAYLFIVKI